MKKIRSLFIILLFPAGLSFGQELYKLPDTEIQTRWASPENWKGEKGEGGKEGSGRKGSPNFLLKAGQQVVLAEASGTSGIIRRIWITSRIRTPQVLRGLKIEMFWDGAKTPAVSSPLGDFFGHGLGQMVPFENALFSSPEGKSFNCIVPMPFKTGMKIVLTNEAGEDTGVFYDVNYTLGDPVDKNTLYFHAWFNRQNPTRLIEDYEVLPRIEGKGRFLGANFSLIVNEREYLGTWWGEGEVKIYLDGDREYPSLVGTGTEDYIGTGWGQGKFVHMYQGNTIGEHADAKADSEIVWGGKYAFYRYHIPDPVFFYRDIKVTLQQIGHIGEFVYGRQYLEEFFKLDRPVYRAGEYTPVILTKEIRGLLFERSDDVSSCTYFYLSEPENKLPPIPSADRRIEGLLRKTD